MDVELSDVLATFAILLSIISLWIAYYSSSFTKKAKNIELRSKLLTKYSKIRLDFVEYKEYCLENFNLHKISPRKYYEVGERLNQLEEKFYHFSLLSG